MMLNMYLVVVFIVTCQECIHVALYIYLKVHFMMPGEKKEEGWFRNKERYMDLGRK